MPFPFRHVVNNNIADVGNELIPRIYKYEWNGTKWDSVWSATMDMPAQNTWPALTTGDLDNDGKPEVIWGPVNNFNGGQLNPSRIIVFEVKGDGSDILGVSNGFGGYTPNAKWSITESESYPG
ncbi:MAG: FG-GAP repeat protein [Ignavibacteriales bacterium]|nr:FG-GAP repeat protein [Ignavibacteriales bacterium]